MCADAPFDKRTYQHRKVFTQTGRVPRKKINIDRGNLLNNKVKYRSKFELNLARTLVSKNVTFFYEQESLNTYQPLDTTLLTFTFQKQTSM